MKLQTLFQKKTVFSFEVFPPKKESGLAQVHQTLHTLRGLSPDFISVTCGAGGDGGNATLQVAAEIKKDGKTQSVAHLPCINMTKEKVLETLKILQKNKIENILALRGDRNPDVTPKTDFRYASDLVSFIKENGNFHIISACYPEGHTEAESLTADIQHLKRKVDAGAGQLISQLFFENGHFYDFLERAHAVGIGVPIQAGIMPVINKKQVQRMVNLCGASLPAKLKRIIDQYEDDPTALREAGIDYAIQQISDLIAQGVDGIHLYTMNNAYVASKINDAVSSLLQPQRITA